MQVRKHPAARWSLDDSLVKLPRAAALGINKGLWQGHGAVLIAAASGHLSWRWHCNTGHPEPAAPGAASLLTLPPAQPVASGS